MNTLPRLRPVYHTLAALALITALGGCGSPAVVVDVATTVAEDRTMGSVLDDATIKIKLNEQLLRDKFRDLFFKVNTDIYEGDVMLTGDVKTTADRRRAGRLVKGINGIRRVYNEIQVSGTGGLKETANDVWIETKLRARLTDAKGVKSINYRWRAVNRVVYLFGLAQDRDELDRVKGIVRVTKHVMRIVSHIRLKK